MKTCDRTMTSTWSSLSSWFTPTILFCFLNLMIAIIFLTSRRKQSDKHPQLGADSPQLARAPSLLQRVKSINFSFNRSDHYTYTPSPVEASQSHVDDSINVEERHEVTRSKSETIVAAPVKIMKSSMSEKQLGSKAEDVDVRRPATVRERKGKGVSTTGRSGEDEGVDDKADDFINRFRQQLKLQRLDSILRYTEMLKRGAGSGN